MPSLNLVELGANLGEQSAQVLEGCMIPVYGFQKILH